VTEELIPKVFEVTGSTARSVQADIEVRILDRTPPIPRFRILNRHTANYDGDSSYWDVQEEIDGRWGLPQTLSTERKLTYQVGREEWAVLKPVRWEPVETEGVVMVGGPDRMRVFGDMLTVEPRIRRWAGS